MKTPSISAAALIPLSLGLGFPLHVVAAPSPQLLGPTLLLQDSVVLQETADHFVGAPRGLALGPNGSFLIPDGFANTVLHFDSKGELVRVFGRQGRGPGEFSGVTDGGFVNDSVLGIVDAFGFKIEIFDFRNGEHIGAVDIEPSERLTSFSLVRDSLWLGGMNAEGWRAVGVSTIDALLAMAREGSGSTPVPFLDRVEVPRPYVTNPMDPRRAVDPLQFVNEVSILAHLSRDERGNIYTLHQEAEMRDRQVQNVTLYVASASPDGSRQCPDTVVPTSGLGLPRARLSGSQLFLLDYGVGTAAGSAVTTIIRRFTIDPVNCTGRVVVKGGG